MKYPQLLLILSMLVTPACEDTSSSETGEAPLSAERTIFYAPAPSQLYFKNVRSAYYYFEKGPAKKMDIYRLRKWELTRKRPQLYPRIVHNWLSDEAYLLLEPNDFPGGFADGFQVRWKGGEGEGILAMGLRTKENQLAFAENLYRHLLAGDVLHIADREGQWHPFLEERSDQSAYLITMKDYLRLIERDRTYR
jgi:hypothetical protein